jgi:hypothetical protein
LRPCDVQRYAERRSASAASGKICPFSPGSRRQQPLAEDDVWEYWPARLTRPSIEADGRVVLIGPEAQKILADVPAAAGGQARRPPPAETLVLRLHDRSRIAEGRHARLRAGLHAREASVNGKTSGRGVRTLSARRG